MLPPPPGSSMGGFSLPPPPGAGLGGARLPPPPGPAGMLMPMPIPMALPMPPTSSFAATGDVVITSAPVPAHLPASHAPMQQDGVGVGSGLESGFEEATYSSSSV